MDTGTCRPAIQIRALGGPEETELCARFMAGSEPWVTLQRTYHESIEMLNDPAREVYVALAGDRVAGFIILRLQGAFVGYIQTVAVLPEWRNRGIGTRLLTFAEERIFGETANVFILGSSFNPGAQRLYERLGYKLIGELTDYIVPGRSELLFRKTVGPLTEFGKTS